MAKSLKNAAELFTQDSGITVNFDKFTTDTGTTVDDTTAEDATQWAMTEETDGIHVRPFVDGEVIMDTPVETHEDYRESEGVDKNVSDNKAEDVFPARGFKCLKDAKEWTESPAFANLCKADQKEFLTWLEKICK